MKVNLWVHIFRNESKSLSYIVSSIAVDIPRNRKSQTIITDLYLCFRFSTRRNLYFSFVSFRFVYLSTWRISCPLFTPPPPPPPPPSLPLCFMSACLSVCLSLSVCVRPPLSPLSTSLLSVSLYISISLSYYISILYITINHPHPPLSSLLSPLSALLLTPSVPPSLPLSIFILSLSLSLSLYVSLCLCLSLSLKTHTSTPSHNPRLPVNALCYQSWTNPPWCPSSLKPWFSHGPEARGPLDNRGATWHPGHCVKAMINQ